MFDKSNTSAKISIALMNQEYNTKRVSDLKRSLLSYCTLDEKLRVTVEDSAGFAGAQAQIKTLTEHMADIDRQLARVEVILQGTGYNHPDEIASRMQSIQTQLVSMGAHLRGSEIPEDIAEFRAKKHLEPVIKQLEAEYASLEELRTTIRKECKDLI